MHEVKSAKVVVELKMHDGSTRTLTLHDFSFTEDHHILSLDQAYSEDGWGWDDWSPVRIGPSKNRMTTTLKITGRLRPNNELGETHRIEVA